MATIVSIFPPSPAISFCDSLEDIDDLDAWLDAQPALSHFPTPPLLKEKTLVNVQEIELDEEDLESEDGSDELDLATAFATHINIDAKPSWHNILVVENILLRARLPMEIVALALNILSHDAVRPVIDGNELLITASFALATVYLYDHPPFNSFWAEHVANGKFTAREIDRELMAIFARLDWQLDRLSSPAAFEAAISKLSYLPPAIMETPLATMPKALPLLPKLRIIEDASLPVVCWGYGQLTPDPSPPVSAIEQFQEQPHSQRNEPNQFLPLL